MLKINLRKNIFPTPHEEKLTFIIISFLIGLVFGIILLLKSVLINDLLPAFATLLAAFFGSWLAYKLQQVSKQKEEINTNIADANHMLFILYRRLNCLSLFQRDIIESIRNDPDYFLTMKPIRQFEAPEDRIQLNRLNFLLKSKHHKLLLDLDIEEQRFIETVNSIRIRSDLHINQYQPAMQAAQVRTSTQIESKNVKPIIGDMLFSHLQQTTDRVIRNVDLFLISSDKIRDTLVKALSEQYSKDDLLLYKMITNQP